MAGYTTSLTWDYVASIAGSDARMRTYFKGDDPDTDSTPKFDDAVALASADADTLISNVLETPLEEPLPQPLLRHIAAMVLDYGTEFADSRPESIDRASARATEFLKDVHAGRRTIEDTVPSTPAGQPIPVVSSGRATNPFDFDDPLSTASRRIRSL